nr:hypothetical protein [Marinitoga lauensis]
MLKINNIKLPIDHSNEDIKIEIAKNLDISSKDIKKIYIRKKSIDARKKNTMIYFIYNVDFEIENEDLFLKFPFISKSPDYNYKLPISGDIPLKHKPIIIGFGPAGIFAD